MLYNRQLVIQRSLGASSIVKDTGPTGLKQQKEQQQ